MASLNGNFDTKWIFKTDLRCGEKWKPLQIDEGAKSSEKSRCLLTDLRVHPEVGHLMDVADSALWKETKGVNDDIVSKSTFYESDGQNCSGSYGSKQSLLFNILKTHQGDG